MQAESIHRPSIHVADSGNTDFHAGILLQRLLMFTDLFQECAADQPCAQHKKMDRFRSGQKENVMQHVQCFGFIHFRHNGGYVQLGRSLCDCRDIDPVLTQGVKHAACDSRGFAHVFAHYSDNGKFIFNENRIDLRGSNFCSKFGFNRFFGGICQIGKYRQADGVLRGCL